MADLTRSANTRQWPAIRTLAPAAFLEAVGDRSVDEGATLTLIVSATDPRYVWQMDGTATMASSYLPPISLAWTIQGTGDFDGDGKSDLSRDWGTSTARLCQVMDGAVTVGPAVSDHRSNGRQDFCLARRRTARAMSFGQNC